jgi:hypothetical protein
MSVPRTCPSCMNGNHYGHSYGWNLGRWAGLGAHCPCEGECETLPDPVARMFAAYIRRRR